MGFVVTTLMENNAAKDGMLTEHGLSLHLTDGSFTLLLDTGATPAFLDNANKLGISLESVDTLVLSHGHYDHTGGVKALLDSGCCPKATYFGPNFFAHRYHREPGRLRPISARVTQEFLFEHRVPLKKPSNSRAKSVLACSPLQWQAPNRWIPFKKRN